MISCVRCREVPGWVITARGDIGQPDTLRPCDGCRREAFEFWREGKCMPSFRMDRVADGLDPGQNIAHLLAIRDRLGA